MRYYYLKYEKYSYKIKFFDIKKYCGLNKIIYFHKIHNIFQERGKIIFQHKNYYGYSPNSQQIGTFIINVLVFIAKQNTILLMSSRSTTR